MGKAVRELKGLIYSKYDSESDFSKAIGWPRQRLNKITTGGKEPNVQEINILSSALGVPIERMVGIFLSCESPND